MYNSRWRDLRIDLELFPGGIPPNGLEQGLDSKILAFYGHLQAARTGEAESTLLNMVGAYPDSVALANMLPGLLATAVPRILGDGSKYFTFADGAPLTFGHIYTPPEYTMVYLELMLHKNLMGHPPLPVGSPVSRTISVMWEIMLDIIPAARKADVIRRFESYRPLPDNVVRLRPRKS